MKKNISIDTINSINNIDELKKLQETLNEACNKRMSVLNVKAEAENLDIPSYLYIKESFENMSETLFKSAKGRKLIGKYIREHKMNKELSKLFHIYENLAKADKTINVTTMIQDMKNMVGEINENKLNAGIDNLKKLLKESYITIGENAKDLLSENKNGGITQYVDYVFTTPLKMDNVVKYNKCINEIKSYVDNNEVKGVTFKKATQVDVDECYARYNNLLSDDNTEILKEIREAENKELVFEKYKNECLASIDEAIKTDIDQFSCDKLYEFKTKIQNKMYNEETLGLDISNFIELKNVVKE
jgi:hypothetical protein